MGSWGGCGSRRRRGRFFRSIRWGTRCSWRWHCGWGEARGPGWRSGSIRWMLLALVGTYLLMRQVVSVFPAILGMIIVAASPVALGLTNNPNSHATTLCAAVWGMYFLFRWWETEK